MQGGITIYAPAIILSTVMGWRLDLTIIFAGLVVIVYTVTGGSVAVSQLSTSFFHSIQLFWRLDQLLNLRGQPVAAQVLL